MHQLSRRMIVVDDKFENFHNDASEVDPFRTARIPSLILRLDW